MKRTMRRNTLLCLVLGIGLLALGPSCRRKAAAPAGTEAEEAKTQTLRLSPESVAAAGLKTERVEFRPFAVPINAYGLVQFDPHSHYHLTARVPGRIEEIFAFEGTRINAGQKLLSFYSPDFLSSQSELLQMLERQKMAQRAGDADERSLADRMLDAAEKKLRFMGLAEDEIRALKEKKETLLLLPIRAPIRGTINEFSAVSGNYVEAGTLLLEISDLRTVWVEARIFEKDIALLEPGLRAEVTLAALPGEKFPGRLTIIGAAVDEASRTAKAVIEVSNPAERLKPGMSASVTLFPRTPTKVLAVPEAAVRKVEGRDVVFVEGPERTFTVREVKPGRALEGFVEILSGLAEGERVATEGSLSLKSELLKKNLEGE